MDPFDAHMDLQGDRKSKPTVEQLVHLFELINKKVVTKASLQDFLEQSARFTILPGAFLIKVEYTQPGYEELASAFDWVHAGYRHAKFEAINDSLKMCREACDSFDQPRVITVTCVCINCLMSTADVLSEMRRHILRPTFYEELLAFAFLYPDEQKKNSIIALGSAWARSDNEHFAASLTEEGDGKRVLGLGGCEGDWYPGTCFLATSMK